MAFVVRRMLAIPVWAIVFVTVVLTAPPVMLFPMLPTTLFVVAALGIAVIMVTTQGVVPRLRTSGARS